MIWNLLHHARMLEDAGGMPVYGNSLTGWEDGHRFRHPDPEYR